MIWFYSIFICFMNSYVVFSFGLCGAEMCFFSNLLVFFHEVGIPTHLILFYIKGRVLQYSKVMTKLI